MPFIFPSHSHLTITTEKRIVSWSANGARTIFTSNSSGILGAKEAPDGDGPLAVADSQVVILHDVGRGMERSYRLKGTDGQIRLLEYSADGKMLYFTTTLQSAVQCYSITQAQLLDPLCAHPSPPTVLAVSPTNHLLLSASENPPTIYLSNLRLGTQPLLIQPNASATAVVAAAFHPERANVFMLAFRDGTAAAYDATRLVRDKSNVRASAVSRTTSKAAQPGEIGFIEKLHAITTRSSGTPISPGSPTKCVGITDVAFMPGHRTRAVTAGADGRCRIVDFEQGGKILRTWHVRGPVTSLSILSSKRLTKLKPALKNTRRGSLDNSEENREIIAIGRLDGKVLLFDFLGLQLCEQVIDRAGGRIIGVDWGKGAGPEGTINSDFKLDVSGAITTPLLDAHDHKSSPSKHNRTKVLATQENLADLPKQVTWTLDGHAPLHLNIQHPPTNGILEVQETITVEEFGTVHYTPGAAGAFKGFAPVQPENYMDLFSPVKPHPEPLHQPRRSPSKAPEKRQGSPIKRPRPRLASDTFVENEGSMSPRSPTLVLNSPSGKTQNSPHKSPSKINTSTSHSATTVQVGDMRLKAGPARKPRRVSLPNGPGALPGSLKTLLSQPSLTSSSSSGKILADLRRVGGVRSRGGLGLLAPYMQPSTTIIETKNKEESKTGKGGESESESRRGLLSTSDELSDTLGQYEDSTKTLLPSDADGNTEDDDIWLTDENPSPRRAQEHSFHHTESLRPKRPVHLPAARYTIHSEASKRSWKAEKEDLRPGSAQSPLGPVSVDEYFPRGSSLPRSPKKGDVLGETSGNRGVRESPVKGRMSEKRSAGRKGRGRAGPDIDGEIFEDSTAESTAPRSSECRCKGRCCGELRAEVDALSREVEALRKEMRALRKTK